MKFPEASTHTYASTPLVVGPLVLKPSPSHGGIVNVHTPDREFTPMATLMFTGPDVPGALRDAAAALIEHADAIDRSVGTYLNAVNTDTPKEA